ncbi:hypothetical protein FACS189427_02380 [Planctomycetales bacterium]|nr:hypothetical protein FACS189427_02380 [Planctomycetales bacterium]
MSEENIVEQTTMFIPNEKVFDGKHFAIISFIPNSRIQIKIVKALTDESGELNCPKGYAVPIPSKRRQSGVYD